MNLPYEALAIDAFQSSPPRRRGCNLGSARRRLDRRESSSTTSWCPAVSTAAAGSSMQPASTLAASLPSASRAARERRLVALEAKVRPTRQGVLEIHRPIAGPRSGMTPCAEHDPTCVLVVHRVNTPGLTRIIRGGPSLGV
jgi:hypothetical protein